MYNIVAGNNPLFWLLARLIETQGKLPPIPRWRDMYTREVEGKAQIVIYSRTGGGNRNEYHTDNEALAAHKLYVENFDDRFDSTFAHFVYQVPVAFEERMLKFHRLFSKHPKGMDPRTKYANGLMAMEGKAVEFEFSPNEVRELERIGNSIAADLPEEPSTIELAILEKTRYGVPK